MTQTINFMDSLSSMLEDFMPSFTPTTDMKDEWNAFVASMKDEMELPDIEYEPGPLKGTGINFLKIAATGLVIGGITVVWVGMQVDLFDFMLMAFWTLKLPILHLSILGFGIPIPTGLIAYPVLKDITVPFSDALQPLIEEPYSGSEVGFTFKDVSIDIFTGWALYKLTKIFGKHAMQPLIALFQWYVTYRKPKVKDILDRIIESGCSYKLNEEEEYTLREAVEHFDLLHTQWYGWYQQMVIWLSNPSSMSRPPLPEI